MKNILKTLAVGTMLVLLTGSCTRVSKNDLKKAETDLKKTATEVKNAAKAKIIADWLLFKHTSDVALATLEKQTNNLETTISKGMQKDKEKLKNNLNVTRQELIMMQKQLKMRNKEFEQEMITFDESISKRNQAFQREFNHDITELDTAMKDLFKNNVN